MASRHSRAATRVGGPAPAIRHTGSIGRPDDISELAGPTLYTFSLGSILLCIGLWIRAKTVGEDERANAERRAIFVGLWPPMFWLIGDTVRRLQHPRRRGLRARR